LQAAPKVYASGPRPGSKEGSLWAHPPKKVPKKAPKVSKKGEQNMLNQNINKNLSDERALLVFFALRGHEDPEWALEQLEILGQLAAIKAMGERE